MLLIDLVIYLIPRASGGLQPPPAACALVVVISKRHPLNPCCCIIVIYDLQLLMHSQVLLAIIIPVCDAKVTASVSYGCLAGL